MLAFEFLVLYLTLGLGIGAAVAISDRSLAAPATPGSRLTARVGTGCTAIVFWPMFLPFLLNRRPETPGRPAPATTSGGPLVRALRRTQQALDAALRGVAGDEALGLAAVLTRMPDVMRSLETQARSVEGMADVLATPPADADDALDPELAKNLVVARAESERRLRALHDQRRDEVLRAVVRLEELVAMVHLARFAREHAGAGPLVQQMTATVEALAELSTEEAA